MHSIKNFFNVFPFKKKKKDFREKQYLEYLRNFHRNFKLRGDYAYLEIGVQRFLSFELSRANFNIGVDPIFKARKYNNSMRNIEVFIPSTSKNFFAEPSYQDIREIFQKFSRKVFFIDGDHTAASVLKDIMGCISLVKATDEATILIHDVLPREEKEIYRNSKFYIGDGFRAIMALRNYTDNIKIFDVDPSGLGIIEQDAIRDLSNVQYSALEEEMNKLKSLSVRNYLSEIKNMIQPLSFNS